MTIHTFVVALCPFFVVVYQNRRRRRLADARRHNVIRRAHIAIGCGRNTRSEPDVKLALCATNFVWFGAKLLMLAYIYSAGGSVNISLCSFWLGICLSRLFCSEIWHPMQCCNISFMEEMTELWISLTAILPQNVAEIHGNTFAKPKTRNDTTHGISPKADLGFVSNFFFGTHTESEITTQTNVVVAIFGSADFNAMPDAGCPTAKIQLTS